MIDKAGVCILYQSITRKKRVEVQITNCGIYLQFSQPYFKIRYKLVRKGKLLKQKMAKYMNRNFAKEKI